MAGSAPSPERVRFGLFEFDPSVGELRKDGASFRLAYQPLQLLLMLLQHPGELVEVDDIRQKLWPAEIYVDFRHGVNNAVNRLRLALGDSAKKCRFVETVPKKGYRFVASVERVAKPQLCVLVRKFDEQARELYLKGRHCWGQRTPQSLTRALRFFQEAVERVPDYACAYAGLSDSYALLGSWLYGTLPPKEAYTQAKAAAIKALELDRSLAEAHVSLANCRSSFDWNYDAAAEEYRHAIELNPEYATAHHWYALLLADMTRYDEAIAEIRKAERLAPCSPVIGTDRAQILLVAGLHKESISQSEKVLHFDPSFAVAHFNLGQAYMGNRMYGAAITELRRAIELSAGSSKFLSNLAYAFGVAGRKGEAAKILQYFESRTQQGFLHFANLASVYAGLDDKDESFAWLEKAYEQRLDPEVLSWPTFDTLRQDGRFRNLMRRVGLPT